MISNLGLLFPHSEQYHCCTFSLCLNPFSGQKVDHIVLAKLKESMYELCTKAYWHFKLLFLHCFVGRSLLNLNLYSTLLHWHISIFHVSFLYSFFHIIGFNHFMPVFKTCGGLWQSQIWLQLLIYMLWNLCMKLFIDCTIKR